MGKYSKRFGVLDAASLSTWRGFVGLIFLFAGMPASAQCKCLFDTNNNGLADVVHTDDDATATVATAAAFGPTASANFNEATADGSTATTTGPDSTAPGDATEAAAEAIAIGNDALTDGIRSVALCDVASAAGEVSLVLGTNFSAKDTGTI